MEPKLSLAKQTFFIHLKDIVSVNTPDLWNEFLKFEKVIVENKKNKMIIHQTIQFFINRVKKSLQGSNNEAKFKKIISKWIAMFKNQFPEDKEWWYMILMYLFYQIESSVEFLIESGNINVKDKEVKNKELQAQSMQKLSLLTNVKLNFDEFCAFCEESKDGKGILSEPDNKNIKPGNTEVVEEKLEKEGNGKINEQIDWIAKEKELSELYSEQCIIKDYHVSDSPRNQSGNSMNCSWEDKVKWMEKKLENVEKMEKEIISLRLEVESLKEGYKIWNQRCNEYEICNVITRFLRHWCRVNNIEYSCFNVIYISKQIKEKGKNINPEYIDKIVTIYYENEINFMISTWNQRETNEKYYAFISDFSPLFSEHNFKPEKSDWTNYINTKSNQHNAMKG